MAMNGGSVSIDIAGIPTGSGLSREIYDLMEAAFGVSAAQVPTSVPGAQQQIANLANAIGQACVTHMVDNAELIVDSGIPVATTGTAAAQTGNTTAPGTGSIT